VADKNIFNDWIDLIPHLTHDFRPSLMTMTLEGSALAEWFPELLKGYRLAVDQGLMEGTLPMQQLKLRAENGSSIAESGKKLSRFLKVLDEGVNVLNNGLSETQPRSLASCVEDIVSQAPFGQTPSRNRITLDISSDIELRFPDYFLLPLLFQLITINYDAFMKLDEGECKVWTETTDTVNRLHFQTTNPKLNQQRINYYFTRCFAEYEGRTVPGLAFCRLALRYFGGDCVSEVLPEKSTKITITFPE